VVEGARLESVYKCPIFILSLGNEILNFRPAFFKREIVENILNTLCACLIG